MAATLTEQTQLLRNRHPTFYYKRCSVSPDPQGLRLDYVFSIAPNLTFTPHIVVPLVDTAITQSMVIDHTVRRLTFLIGMVELLSYWKLCCSPHIEIDAGYLDSEELAYWEHLIRHGLGEFFFVNRISPAIDLSIVCSLPGEPGIRELRPSPACRDNSNLVLVGGGKDSVVTLEILRRAFAKAPGYVGAFALNPIPASINAIRTAHYPALLVGQRTIDPLLHELNTQGYLNGHTPFSALLAFLSTLTAYVNGYQRVLASNEASASEGNTELAGFEINHQYSKSFEFERGFREYMARLNLPVEYVSFLRPLNELQICALFSAMKHHHSIFRSCNREQTLVARNRAKLTEQGGSQPHRSGWCARCPKCVFTFLCLRCFLGQEDMQGIFGVDPSSLPEFGPLVGELSGFSEHKPFECVGTFEEVRSCVAYLIEDPTFALAREQKFRTVTAKHEIASATPLGELLNRWNPNHFLNSSLESALREALSSTQPRFLP
jgi:hypothetical protein